MRKRGNTASVWELLNLKTIRCVSLAAGEKAHYCTVEICAAIIIMGCYLPNKILGEMFKMWNIDFEVF